MAILVVVVILNIKLTKKNDKILLHGNLSSPKYCKATWSLKFSYGWIVTFYSFIFINEVFPQNHAYNSAGVPFCSENLRRTMNFDAFIIFFNYV